MYGDHMCQKCEAGRMGGYPYLSQDEVFAYCQGSQENKTKYLDVCNSVDAATPLSNGADVSKDARRYIRITTSRTADSIASFTHKHNGVKPSDINFKPTDVPDGVGTKQLYVIKGSETYTVDEVVEFGVTKREFNCSEGVRFFYITP